MTDVAGLLKRAYRDMNPSTGMFPAQPCRACGKELNADGNHPAELYAGTFTGLCYGCERSNGYVREILPDGCQVWDYPPACPSWRRSREEKHGYPDCPSCGGSGFKWASSYGGGRYRHYCKPCHSRLWAPQRANARSFFSQLADALGPLEPAIPEGSTALDIVKVTVAENAVRIAAQWDSKPSVWRVSASHAGYCEHRIKAASLRAKRPTTILRAVVAALREEAADARWQS